MTESAKSAISRIWNRSQILIKMASNNAMMQLLEKIEDFFQDQSDLPTLQDLKNPTSTMVYKFLGRGLLEFGIEMDSLKMAHYSQSTCSAYPDNYTEIIPYINLYKIYRDIFDIADIKVDFSMRDILQPRPNRNVKVMNAVMDFLDFADKQVYEMTPIFDEIRNAKEKAKQIEEAKQMLRKDINEAMHREKQIDERKRELTEKLEILKRTLSEKHEKKDEMEKQKQVHIAELKDSENKLAKSIKALKELTEERDKIRSRIVDSPQHIIADIENLRRKRSELRNDLELLGQNIGDVKAKNSQMNSLLGILADKRKNMKEAQVLCKTISELELKLKEETSKLDSLDRAHKEMEKRLLNVQKKQKVAEQQEREVCDQNEEAIRNLKLTLDEKKGTLASQTKCTEESSIAYKELEAESEAVTVEFNTVRETCTQVMQVLYDNYQQMLQQRENFAHNYLNHFLLTLLCESSRLGINGGIRKKPSEAVIFRTSLRFVWISMSTFPTEPPCISYLDRHILRYNYDYLNADLADVIFVVNGKKFPAQSHILGGASDQFTSLIQDHFKENTDKEITLHNVKYSASFSAVLKYIYGFDLNLWDHLIDTLCEICHLARDYSLPVLHERLTCYLSKYRAITLENAATLITTADTHNIHTLTERVTNFLHQNAGELIQHESFLRIEHGVLMDLLESDLFYAREIDILSAVLRWIDFNVKTEKSHSKCTLLALATPRTSMSSSTSRMQDMCDQRENSLQASPSLVTNEDSQEIDSPNTSVDLNGNSDGNVLKKESDTSASLNGSFATVYDGLSVSDRQSDVKTSISENLSSNTVNKEEKLEAIPEEDLKEHSDLVNSGTVPLEIAENVITNVRFSKISMADFFKVNETDLFVKYRDSIHRIARGCSRRENPRLQHCHVILSMRVVDHYSQESEPVPLGHRHSCWMIVHRHEYEDAVNIVLKVCHLKKRTPAEELYGRQCAMIKHTISLKAAKWFEHDHNVTRENFDVKYFKDCDRSSPDPDYVYPDDESDPDPDTAEPNEEVSPNSTNDNHDTSRDSIHFETISDSEIDEEELDYILRNKEELEYYESKENSLLLLSHDILFDSDHFVDKDGSYNVELYVQFHCECKR
ncbi:hypothetical protein M8J77_010671 [Diaphorina citri]|nr:hypothetical protein M8J77_010671 [Diaphorina citri]